MKAIGLIGMTTAVLPNVSSALHVVFWQDSIDVVPNHFVEISNTNEANLLQKTEETDLS